MLFLVTQSSRRGGLLLTFMTGLQQCFTLCTVHCHSVVSFQFALYMLVCCLACQLSVLLACAQQHPCPLQVAFVEWLDPLFVGGHWTPEMIKMAGATHPLNMPM